MKNKKQLYKKNKMAEGNYYKFRKQVHNIYRSTKISGRGLELHVLSLIWGRCCWSCRLPPQDTQLHGACCLLPCG